MMLYQTLYAENNGSCIVVTEKDITCESASIEMSKETSNLDPELSSGVPNVAATGGAIPDLLCTWTVRLQDLSLM